MNSAETEILNRIHKLESERKSVEGELRGLRVALAVSQNKPLPPETPIHTNGAAIVEERASRRPKDGKTQWVRDAINEVSSDKFTTTNIMAMLKAKGREIPRFRVSTILNKMANDRKEISVEKAGAGRTQAIYKKPQTNGNGKH